LTLAKPQPWSAAVLVNACSADPDGDLAERHDPKTRLIPLAIAATTGSLPTRDGTLRAIAGAGAWLEKIEVFGFVL